jgi:hypothetical protein
MIGIESKFKLTNLGTDSPLADTYYRFPNQAGEILRKEYREEIRAARSVGNSTWSNEIPFTAKGFVNIQLRVLRSLNHH